MNTFRLTIAAPDGKVYDEPAVQLSVRGSEGSLSILAGHIPFATMVTAGPCRIYRPDGTLLSGVCGGGFLSVTREETRLLVQTFEWAKDEGESGGTPQ